MGRRVTGSVLSTSELQRRLERGQIFRPGSWTADGLRAAAYDLRIAHDVMIVPQSSNESGRRYPRGKLRTQPVILRPGDVAFVSSMERFCVPWDIAGNIGIKFGFARRGILILTGLLVDPGFGLRKNKLGSWVPKEDERLHFLLANLGDSAVSLQPGVDKVASVQFLTCGSGAQRREVVSAEDMEQEFFDPDSNPSVGLHFFTEMAKLRTRVQDAERRVDELQLGSNPLIAFGIYLVAATLLGVVLAQLLQILTDASTMQQVRRGLDVLALSWPRALFLTTLVIGAIVLIARALEVVVATLLRLGKPRSTLVSRWAVGRQRHDR